MRSEFSLTIKRALPVLFLLFLVSCADDGEKKTEKSIHAKTFQLKEYLLNADVSRFVGNTSIPDFRFSETFLKNNHIRAISCTEKNVVKKRPADTIKISPAIIWLSDSTGKTKELQLYDDKGNRIHTEFFLLESELPMLAQKNADPMRSGATIYFYNRDTLKMELRVEPQNADTTKYFYSGGRIDSVTVSAVSGNKFYIRFAYNEEGTISRRVVKQPGAIVPAKDWAFIYNPDGTLKTIKEMQAGGGAYNFKWDIEGKLSSVEYLLEGITVFSKTYSYDESGFISTLRLETPEEVSFFTFGYAR